MRGEIDEGIPWMQVAVAVVVKDKREERRAAAGGQVPPCPPFQVQLPVQGGRQAEAGRPAAQQPGRPEQQRLTIHSVIARPMAI